MKTVLAIGMLISLALIGCSSSRPQTRSWVELKGNMIEYYTNNQDEFDWTRWKIFEGLSRQDTNTYEIEARKLGGNEETGFGMLFCADKKNEGDSFYCFGIALNKKYSIRKRANNAWKTVIDWTLTDKLKAGNKAVNTIKIVKDGNSFAVYINGTQETSFTDTTALPGQQIGFAVVIGKENQEEFPQKPVNVQFSIKDNPPAKGSQSAPAPAADAPQTPAAEPEADAAPEAE